jgi:flagellar hook protein FlgE
MALEAPVMSALSVISLSGMNAAQTALGASAHNIANASTGAFRREQVTQRTAADGGVTTSMSQSAQAGDAIETDIVGQLIAGNQFLANLAVFKTNDRVLGALLDATS